MRRLTPLRFEWTNAFPLLAFSEWSGIGCKTSTRW